MKVIITCFIIYAVYGLSIYTFQSSLLFPGKHIRKSEVSETNIHNFEKVWLKTSFGRVEAWYMPVRDRSDKKHPAVIFAHGNYELIDYCLDLSGYNKLGIDLLLVEFPGYGRSEGSPSEITINESFVKAYDWLIENKNVDADRIIAHGRSIGGGPACSLARERNIRALILQSTFTGVKQFAIRYLLPSFLVRDPFDNLSVVRSFNGPILIFHGKHDNVIPYKNGVELYNNSKNGKLITYDCHHNDCPPDWDAYWESIRVFLKENGII